MKNAIKDFIDTKKRMEEKYLGYTFETEMQGEWVKPDSLVRVKDCRCVEEKRFNDDNIWHWVTVFQCTKHLDRA